MDLETKKCVACEGIGSALDSEGIKKYQDALTGEWEVVGEKHLKKKYTFKNFVEALKFVNKVGDIAESEGHHPDLFIHYNEVTIDLWTHALNGLTPNDFIVARKIEMLT